MIRKYSEQHAFASAALTQVIAMPSMKNVLTAAVNRLIPSEIADDYLRIMHKLDESRTERLCSAHTALLMVNFWELTRQFFTSLESRQDFDCLLGVVWFMTSELNSLADELKPPPELREFAAAMTSYQMVEKVSVEELTQTFVQNRTKAAVFGTVQKDDDGDEVIAFSLKRSQVEKFAEFIRQSIYSGEFFERNFPEQKFEITDEGISMVTDAEMPEVEFSGEEWSDILEVKEEQ